MRAKPEELRLGYAFAPSPRWLIEEWIHRRLSDEAFHLHVVLYHRANASALAKRQELLPIRLDALARDLGRPADAVQRLPRHIGERR